ncbi:MAG: radical SAM protein [Thermosphaera sp.]
MTQKGEERKYYRFRGGRWYGGVATGDVVGCNLRCKFCWSWRFSHSTTGGWFESIDSAFSKLVHIAEKNNYYYVRLSGGEPTLSREHLLGLMKLLSETKYTFILETNGILLGYDESYAAEISRFSNIAVRVSFKGTTPDEFHLLTGANPSFFSIQLRSLENLITSGLQPCKDFYPAVMLSFSKPESYVEFKERLKALSPRLASCIDEEYVILYPHVVEVLRKYNLKPTISYSPGSVPDFMI